MNNCSKSNATGPLRSTSLIQLRLKQLTSTDDTVTTQRKLQTLLTLIKNDHMALQYFNATGKYMDITNFLIGDDEVFNLCTLILTESIISSYVVKCDLINKGLFNSLTSRLSQNLPDHIMNGLFRMMVHLMENSQLGQNAFQSSGCLDKMLLILTSELESTTESCQLDMYCLVIQFSVRHPNNYQNQTAVQQIIPSMLKYFNSYGANVASTCVWDLLRDLLKGHKYNQHAVAKGCPVIFKCLKKIMQTSAECEENENRVLLSSLSGVVLHLRNHSIVHWILSMDKSLCHLLDGLAHSDTHVVANNISKFKIQVVAAAEIRNSNMEQMDWHLVQLINKEQILWQRLQNQSSGTQPQERLSMNPIRLIDNCWRYISGTNQAKNQ